MNRALFFAIGLCLMASQASAHYAGTQLAVDSKSAPDLVFPEAVTAIAEATSPRMMLLRPEGNGPFPAVALGHQCAGLIFNKANPRAVNWSMLEWAKTFVQNGYVTLLVDFMDQRNARSVCALPENGVTFGRTAKDFMQAAEYLRMQPGVDPSRVGLVGFSQGAIIGLLSNSKGVRENMKTGDGFNAYVSYYPLCGYARNGPGNFAGQLVQDDMDRPHLVFTGGLDNETPFEDCQKRLKSVIEKGRPVVHTHFENATHCFDCKALNGFTKRGHHGQVTYTYNPEATEMATKQMFEFLRQNMPPK